MAKRAGYVTAVSEAVAGHYHRHLGIVAHEVIPDAVPGAAVRVSAETPGMGREPGAPLRLVLPGRVTREKGHAVAVQACKRLLDEGRDLKLEILGDGPLRGTVERQVQSLGIGDRVTVHSVDGHEAFLRRVATADICLVPSLHEGLGIVALEAMQLGVPLIASDVGGLSEIVEHRRTGLLVPPGDVDALAGACSELMKNQRLKNSLSKAAKRHVLNNFSMDVIGPSWVRVYKS